jgi:hypothetical protein
MVSNSGDSSASHDEVLSSQTPIQNWLHHPNCLSYNSSTQTTQKHPIFNSTSVVAQKFVAAGTCLPSCCLETSLVYSPLSWSWHSNSSKYYNIVICTPIARQWVGKQNKFPQKHILGKQSVARLCNNSDNRRNVFNVVCITPSARQRNYKDICNNRSCFLCMICAEVLWRTRKVICKRPQRRSRESRTRSRHGKELTVQRREWSMTLMN